LTLFVGSPETGMLAACGVVSLLQLDEEMADVSRRDLAFEVFKK